MEKDVNPNDELIGEETKRRKITQKIEILHALNNNSRLNKIAKSQKNVLFYIFFLNTYVLYIRSRKKQIT